MKRPMSGKSLQMIKFGQIFKLESGRYSQISRENFITWSSQKIAVSIEAKQTGPLAWRTAPGKVPAIVSMSHPMLVKRTPSFCASVWTTTCRC